MRRPAFPLTVTLFHLMGVMRPNGTQVSSGIHREGSSGKTKCKYGTKTVTKRVHRKKRRVEVCNCRP